MEVGDRFHRLYFRRKNYNSFSVEKDELNWFKFISKKSGHSYGKELSMTCGAPRKAVNAANA